MEKIRLAVIPGDGIGHEVMPGALKILERLAELHGGLKFEFEHYDYGCDYYLQHGEMMPEDGIDRLSESDAVFLGAVGDVNKVPDHISLWGLLIKIRREFQQEINVRPAKVFEGVKSPLGNPKEFDLIVVRENSEGEYSSVGGRMFHDEHEVAIQSSVFSKRATSQVMEYAFKLAQSRGNMVTSATKSNGIYHAMPFWDDVFKEVSKEYPDVSTTSEHIDALSASFVTRPERYDVVVASNLFGDILSDIGAGVMGSIGIAPSANLNMNGKYPSMFEPVHGSAPDIAGRGLANPIGQIWTAKMLLDHFGYKDLGSQLLKAIEDTLRAGIMTPDIGGDVSTDEVTASILNRL